MNFYVIGKSSYQIGGEPTTNKKPRHAKLSVFCPEAPRISIFKYVSDTSSLAFVDVNQISIVANVIQGSSVPDADQKMSIFNVD